MSPRIPTQTRFEKFLTGYAHVEMLMPQAHYDEMRLKNLWPYPLADLKRDFVHAIETQVFTPRRIEDLTYLGADFDYEVTEYLIDRWNVHFPDQSVQNPDDPWSMEARLPLPVDADRFEQGIINFISPHLQATGFARTHPVRATGYHRAALFLGATYHVCVTQQDADAIEQVWFAPFEGDAPDTFEKLGWIEAERFLETAVSPEALSVLLSHRQYHIGLPCGAARQLLQKIIPYYADRIPNHPELIENTLPLTYVDQAEAAG